MIEGQTSQSAPGIGRGGSADLAESPRRLDFRLLVAGQVISTGGDMFFIVALPFLVFRAHQPVAALTATLTAFGLTRLITALPGGALADHLGPKRVMIGADAIRGVMVMVLAIAAVRGWPGLLLLITTGTALGAGEGCYEPAERSALPLLVTDDQLPGANSVTVASNMFARVIGPALGGVGVVLASPAVMLALDAASFACSAVTLLLIRGGRRQPAAPGGGPGADGGPGTVAEFFRHSAFFRVVTLMMAVVGLSVAGTLQVGLPVLASRAGLGADGYGYLMSALGAGMVIGGLSGGRLGRLPHQGWQAIALVTVNAALFALLPSLPGTVGKLAGMVMLGASDGALTVIVITKLQRMPPPRLRGRVLSVLSFAMFATYPLSILVAGTVVTHLSPAAMFRLTGIGIAVVAVIGAASRPVRGA